MVILLCPRVEAHVSVDFSSKVDDGLQRAMVVDCVGPQTDDPPPCPLIISIATGVNVFGFAVGKVGPDVMRYPQDCI